MEIKTRYITPDDFNIYFQMDLVEKFGTTEKAQGFLKRIENRMESYINTNFFKNINDRWFKFSEYQKEQYKLALLEQAIYVFRNGDISVDSGYDLETGKKINRGDLKQIAISQNAITHLTNCGLWNRHIGPWGFGLW